MKIVKKIGLQAISLLSELVSSLIEVFWLLLMYWMLNAGISIPLYSAKSVLFDGNLWIMRICEFVIILYLTEVYVEHLQTCKLNSTISAPLFPRR